MKKKKHVKTKFILYSLLFLVMFVISIHTLNKFNFEISNEEFLKYIIEDSSIYMKNNKKKNIYYYIVKTVLNIDLSNPSSIFTNNYFASVSTSSDDIEDSSKTNKSSYIEDPYPKEDEKEPLVYIYNTHQLEEYSKDGIEEYDVVPNVMMASYILREKLHDSNIGAIVETADINEFLHANNWNYASSYKVTRFLMEEAYSSNNSLKYFIDLHRDSVKKSISTTTINNKNYAKILFIVGLENPNYQANLNLTEKISNKLEENYPGIVRGIYKKQGPGVNGVYNQDFSENVILIELGGEENTIDEVLNSTLAISDVLLQIIKEDNL